MEDLAFFAVDRQAEARQLKTREITERHRIERSEKPHQGRVFQRSGPLGLPLRVNEHPRETRFRVRHFQEFLHRAVEYLDETQFLTFGLTPFDSQLMSLNRQSLEGYFWKSIRIAEVAPRKIDTVFVDIAFAQCLAH